jgi:hypothetical protein
LYGTRLSDGRLATLAVQPGASDAGGVLSPRAYAVSRADATGDALATPSPLVAIAPQPGAEASRVALTYECGDVVLFDLHRRRPVATARASSSSRPIRAAEWVGASGTSLATAHDDGVVTLWKLPSARAHRRRGAKPFAISATRAWRPHGSEGDDDEAEFAPCRAILARARGGVGAPYAKDRKAADAVIAVIGGEPFASLDPVRVASLAFDRDVENFAPRAGVPTASLPWFGPVVAGALAPPSGRHDTAASAVILSEGGQLHVHDVRAFADGVGDEISDAAASGGESPRADPSLTGFGDAPSTPTSASSLPTTEALELLPRIDPTSIPSIAIAADAFVGLSPAANPDDGEAAKRKRWGSAWPMSGGREVLRGNGNGAATRHVVAAAEGGGGGAVRVAVEGGGRLTQIATARPGINAGMSPRDRAVTRCHVALGGALLFIGRASGAVEVHTTLPVPAAKANLVRQLDSSLDLAMASSSSDDASDNALSDNALSDGGVRYKLVGELGVHTAPITCIVTDARCAKLAVGDASGDVTVTDLTRGEMKFHLGLGAFYTLVPIRPRRRGERRSLRTLPGASLRPTPAFNPRPRRLSTPTDAYELHPDVRLYGTALSVHAERRHRGGGERDALLPARGRARAGERPVAQASRERRRRRRRRRGGRRRCGRERGREGVADRRRLRGGGVRRARLGRARRHVVHLRRWVYMQLRQSLDREGGAPEERVAVARGRAVDRGRRLPRRRRGDDAGDNVVVGRDG